MTLLRGKLWLRRAASTAPPRCPDCSTHTLYSATNDSEDFAESFMLYCVKDPDLSHRSFKYFHDLENRLKRDAASGYSTDSDDE